MGDALAKYVFVRSGTTISINKIVLLYGYFIRMNHFLSFNKKITYKGRIGFSLKLLARAVNHVALVEYKLELEHAIPRTKTLA